jgi:hypothetical protein
MMLRATLNRSFNGYTRRVQITRDRSANVSTTRHLPLPMVEGLNSHSFNRSSLPSDLE